MDFTAVMILWLVFVPMAVIFTVLIVLLIVNLAKNSTKYQEYREIYKKEFVEKNLRKVFTDLTYDHKAGISRQTLLSTGMVNTGDRYHSNDLMFGQYKNIRFAQADVHIQEEEYDSDGHTSYDTIFRGRWMMFNFPKKFEFRMEVVSSRFRAGTTPRGRTASGKKFKKVETESASFNRKFRIYAEDGFEAFYLLDPALMEKIEKLYDYYKRPLILCFVDEILHVGLDDGKDSFEPPHPWKKTDSAAEDAKVMQDIKVITDFVDGLSLDKKLFKGGTAWII